ncbi:MAG: HlyD family efflux transporter periplasmic adaptor subunit [Chloroherpetonaceae bacterium]|nr:HlyD family efflux transporter periplasmic adaptor subunit [Chthonomonadaceae bacterium]MDW8207705.1 HlyD family efflux transporter periplasmic adaptor subunit [Chloroherpetonaceae bacterium]
MAKRWLVGCGAATVALVSVAYFSVRAYLRPKPQSGRTETVQRGDVEVKVVETGTVEPLRKVEVKSKAGGRVLKLFVDEGAVVRQGQVLATTDAEEVSNQVAALRAQLAGAQARLEAARKAAQYQQEQTRAAIAQNEQAVAAARARLRQIETEAQTQPELTRRDIEIAEANLEAARAQLRVQQDALRIMLETTHPQAIVSAQATYDRLKTQADNAARNAERQRQLLARGFVSQQVVENAEAEAQALAAQVREARERLDRIRQANALEAANARNQVANAQANVHQMEAALERARRNVLPAIKQRELESARAALAQAEAQLAAARSGQTQDAMRRDEVIAAQAAVEQLQKQLNELLVRQRDTTLYAAMSGVITKRYVEEGELITSAVSSFSSGTTLFHIADLRTMIARINVNEVDIARIRPGQPVEVRIDAARTIHLAGRVRRVAPAAAGSATATAGSTVSAQGQNVVRFPVEIQIEKPDPRLKPGMSARCTIFIARRRNVLRIPNNCVRGEGPEAEVQVVTQIERDGQKVEQISTRKVRVGLRGDDFVEIVSGLKEGEKVRPYPFTGPPRKTIDLEFGGSAS